jgi:hypothetical protein
MEEYRCAGECGKCICAIETYTMKDGKKYCLDCFPDYYADHMKGWLRNEKNIPIEIAEKIVSYYV